MSLPKKNKLQSWSRKSFLLWLALFGFLCFSSSLGAIEDLPQIGGISAMSINEEKKLGRIWWQKNYHNFNPISDYVLRSYARHLVALLAQTEQMQIYSPQVYILPERTLNAFAAPGGIIGIHLGLWSYANTEEEFASVIAHELAHLSQRHFARMLQDARSGSTVSLASILTGLGLILAGNPSAGALAIYGTIGYQQERFLALSRRYEREADNLAYHYMERGGFSAVGALNMFYRMDALTRDDSIPEYMSTHPLTAERLNIARLRAANSPAQAPSQATDYPFTRLRALFYMDALDTATSNTPQERDYARALKLSARGLYAEAAELMLRISTNRPKSQFLFFSAIDAQLQAGQGEKARILLETRSKYLGESATLHYFLAKAYEQEKDWDSALLSMLLALKQDEENADIWHHLARYYAKQENNYAYFRSDAIYRILIGRERAAQRSLELAQQYAAGDKILLTQLEDARLRYNIPAPN